jgi:hypothetical protein
VTCACGNPTSDPRFKSCRRCTVARLNSDPEIKARRRAGLKRYAAEHRDKHLERARRAGQTKRNNPELIAHLRERMREVCKFSVTPEALARRDNVQRGRALSNTRLAWCPPEYRDLHRRNINSRHMTSAQSRMMIERIVATKNNWLDSAIHWLRRIAPIKSEGSGYRYGRTLLSADEVIERAKRKGWKPYEHRPSGTLGGVSTGWMG